MQIQKVTACQAFKGQREREVAKPKFVCATCVKLSADNGCPVFQRPVEPDYNRCFYHSSYQPVVVIFRPVKNLDTMVDDGKGKGLQYA